MVQSPDEIAENRDARTLALLHARDPEGLRRLLQDHGGLVVQHLRTVFRRALGHIELDDAVGRAMLRAWEAAPGFDLSQGTLRAWLFVTARNYALVILRATKRARRLDVELDAFLEVLAWLDPSLSQQQRLLRIADFQGCLQLLPLLHRQVLQADLDADGTAATGELAARLGVSERSVANARARGRARIRAMMQRLGHFADRQAPTERRTDSEPEFGR